jgi:ubiquinone/menaquinone biosynthesis C-methylase UbiE
MYNAVIQADYMKHGELVAKLADWAQKQSNPLRIIDLGCGDAWLATRVFRNANVDNYLGVDVSDSAVELARDHIAIWPGRAEVVAGNLAEFLRGLPNFSANVVLASYSLHHFLSPQKVTLISECHRILAPGGSFLWIDAVRDDDESRDAYLQRLTYAMQHDWTALTEEQRANACRHVWESDFPETASWMIEHVQQAGFECTETILKDEFFDGWVFTKP